MQENLGKHGPYEIVGAKVYEGRSFLIQTLICRVSLFTCFNPDGIVGTNTAIM